MAKRGLHRPSLRHWSPGRMRAQPRPPIGGLMSAISLRGWLCARLSVRDGFPPAVARNQARRESTGDRQRDADFPKPCRQKTRNRVIDFCPPFCAVPACSTSTRYEAAPDRSKPFPFVPPNFQCAMRQNAIKARVAGVGSRNLSSGKSAAERAARFRFQRTVPHLGTPEMPRIRLLVEGNPFDFLA
jgi:hypothetical protein